MTQLSTPPLTRAARLTELVATLDEGNAQRSGVQFEGVTDALERERGARIHRANPALGLAEELAPGVVPGRTVLQVAADRIGEDRQQELALPFRVHPPAGLHLRGKDRVRQEVAPGPRGQVFESHRVGLNNGGWKKLRNHGTSAFILGPAAQRRSAGTSGAPGTCSGDPKPRSLRRLPRRSCHERPGKRTRGSATTAAPRKG